MTTTITPGIPAGITNAKPGIAARLRFAIAAARDNLSTRLHAGGDAYCSDLGLTVTRETGRLGFGARVYRDPRFDSR
jgi:hypothetical protein